MKVAYVHGAGQRDRDQATRDLGTGLDRGWSVAGLTTGRERVQVSTAFYGHLLAGLLPGRFFRGHPMENPPTPESATYVRCPCCPQGRGYQLYAGVQRAVATPLRLAGLIVDAGVRDVHLYTDIPVVRDAIRTHVANHLMEHEPQVVVAHSLGTVVLLDALRQVPAQVRPNLIVTAGSPLGRVGLFDPDLSWLEGNATPAWLNLVDLSDTVTGAALLSAPKFPSVMNYVVDNDHFASWFGPDGGPSATHNLVHYMTHPVTAWILDQVAQGGDASTLLARVPTYRTSAP